MRLPVLRRRNHAVVNRGAGVSPAAIPAKPPVRPDSAESPNGGWNAPDQHCENWRRARTPAPRNALIRGMDAALRFAVWLAIGTFFSNDSLLAAPPLREVPNPTAVPANQLAVSGNACGPAALLNAFRFGNPHWQRAADAVTGNNDRERIFTIIRELGMRPSKNLPGRPRWNRRGVGVADLKDMANEMTRAYYMPQLGDEVFFIKPRESPEKLLRRVHHRLEGSLAKGFPPVISLRRHALRKQKDGTDQWVVIDAHFVTLSAIPRKLEKNARSFPVRYIDPWGGRHCEGRIAIPDKPVLPDPRGHPSCLEAQFPDASVGAKLLRRGEQSVLVIPAAIGRW